MTKGLIKQKDITTINMYTPNKIALQYMKQTLTKLKEETEKSTIILGDFNTSI